MRSLTAELAANFRGKSRDERSRVDLGRLAVFFRLGYHVRYCAFMAEEEFPMEGRCT